MVCFRFYCSYIKYILLGSGTQWNSSPAAALTKVDDTNITLTLGGTPTASLINAVSITAGWSGTLSAARGGTGVGTLGDLTRVMILM